MMKVITFLLVATVCAAAILPDSPMPHKFCRDPNNDKYTVIQSTTDKFP